MRYVKPKGSFMNTESARTRFSPSIILVILAAALVIVLSGLFVFRSLLSGSVLDSIDAGDFRFDLCGSGSLSQIKVYENGTKTATVRTPSVGNAEDHYGVTVSDLTLDGYPDLLVAVKKRGDAPLCNAWVWNPATGTFRAQESFVGIESPEWNEEYGCLTSHYEERRKVGEDADGVYYEEAEVIAVYAAVNGTLVEFMRYEFVYYTRSEVYAVLVSRFDEKTGELSSFSEDEWLSGSEATAFSLTDFVEVDMALHRDSYPNAAK